jgi:hypothetical protein
MTANIIQTMKQVVKASVLTIRTDQAFGASGGVVADMPGSPLGCRYCRPGGHRSPSADGMRRARQTDDASTAAFVLKN